MKPCIDAEVFIGLISIFVELNEVLPNGKSPHGVVLNGPENYLCPCNKSEKDVMRFEIAVQAEAKYATFFRSYCIDIKLFLTDYNR